MGEMRDRMLRGELYIAEDEDNAAEFGRVQDLLAFVNVDAVVLDVLPVTIGAACQIATRVHCSPPRIRSTPSRAGSAGSTPSPSRSRTTSGSAAASSSAPG
jgi:hypothetical protein